MWSCIICSIFLRMIICTNAFTSFELVTETDVQSFRYYSILDYSVLTGKKSLHSSKLRTYWQFWRDWGSPRKLCRRWCLLLGSPWNVVHGCCFPSTWGKLCCRHYKSCFLYFLWTYVTDIRLRFPTSACDLNILLCWRSLSAVDNWTVQWHWNLFHVPQ